MEFPFRTSTPSQSEIFSQDCYCGLLCSLLSGSSTPSQREIFSLKLLLWLALSARMYVLVRTSTPSQREIFSQTVIVACSLCSYVCIGLPGPAHPPKVKYSVKAVIVACSYGVSFQALHTLPKRDTVNLTVCEILIFASMRSCPSLEKTH